MMPVVAHTVALEGERPTANAFGMSVSATATRGLGRSAWTHSRSIIAWNSGACSGVTSRAPIACSASLSDVKNCASSSATAITPTKIAPAPAASRATMSTT